MFPHWKHVGLWLLLFSGVGAFVGNVAALFGYGGSFTLVPGSSEEAAASDDQTKACRARLLGRLFNWHRSILAF
jgi:hypothetical protein